MLIESERLQLRPFSPDDKSSIIACLMDPDFMAFSLSGVLSEEEACQRFDQLLNQPKGSENWR